MEKINERMIEMEKILLDLILKSRHIKNFKSTEKNKIKKMAKVFNECQIYDFSNIKKIGAGTYSTVYKIGNKVIKIGLAKLNTEIVENPRVVHCLFKSNITFETQNIKTVVGIEIQEFADMEKEKDFKKLYEIYKELRKAKLIWTDIKLDNVGYENEKLVIVDTDSIYQEDDPKLTWFTSIAKEFEERYNTENKKE